MRVIIVFAGLIALCTSKKAFSLIPGDNRGYVEGESRYIWMPDGEGNPVLVDLQEPNDQEKLSRSYGDDNQYWFYSRNNPSTPIIITHGDANSIWNAGYDASRPLNVIVHGWRSSGSSPMNPLITAAFLAVQDANVIVVDWSALANRFYTFAFRGVADVGKCLGNFLVWLIRTAGGNWDRVHLVGFSLGAHVVGNAGRTTGGLPARVTGLDPAGPGFYYWYKSYRLSPSDGQYVEAIHTDGNLLGLFTPMGNTDFYANGGTNPQPGCWFSMCSHTRSTELFAASVQFNRFVGRLCLNLSEVKSKCTGDSYLNMGNGDVTKFGNGIYALNTDDCWPY